MIDEARLEKVLQYLAQRYSWQVRKTGERKFSLANARIRSHDEYNRRDYSVLYLDFSDRSASFYAAMESHHNGDHYDCIQGVIPWEQAVDADMLSVYESRMHQLVDEQLQRETRENAVRQRMEEILKG